MVYASTTTLAVFFFSFKEIILHDCYGARFLIWELENGRATIEL